MPAAELIVWLVPGYLTLLLYLHSNPLRTKQSYEWFFQAAGLGMLCFVVASIFTWLIGIMVPLLPCVFGSCLSEAVAASWLRRHIPFAYGPTWIIGIFPGSLASALVLNWIRPLWQGMKRATTRAPRYPVADIFHHACRQLEGKLVILSVDGGKVYVGVLKDYTSDPDEPEKFIKIIRVMSGRRKDDDPFVEFTTPYLTFGSDTNPGIDVLDELSEARAALIPVKKISTFAPFDYELHKWFVAKGLVHVSFDRDLPPSNE